MKDGIINVYKPAGLTSNDIIYKMRAVLGIKKLGHTGTLDPLATGVLPVCINKGTRVAEYMDMDFKTYRCTMVLGIITDSLDVTGNVLETRDTGHVSASDIEDAFKPFTGLIDQMPPLTSAVRINGRRLYEYIHSGEEIPESVMQKIRPRQVYIRGIQVENIDLDTFLRNPEHAPGPSVNGLCSQRNPRVTFTVECSKGTYIRSIVRDAGEILGCGATMESLERIASGYFTVDNSVTLDELIDIAVREGICEREAGAERDDLPKTGAAAEEKSASQTGDAAERKTVSQTGDAERKTASETGAAERKTASETGAAERKTASETGAAEEKSASETGDAAEKVRRIPERYMLKRLVSFGEEIPEAFSKYVIPVDVPLTHFGTVSVSKEDAKKFVDGWHLSYRDVKILSRPDFEEITADLRADDGRILSKEDLRDADPRSESNHFGSYPGLKINPEFAKMYRVYAGNTFIGVARHSDTYHKLVADKVFFRPEEEGKGEQLPTA